MGEHPNQRRCLRSSMFLGRRFRVRVYGVAGESMLPTFKPGEFIRVDTKSERAPQVGDVVLIRDPELPSRHLVKRVSSRGDVLFAVSSDNPWGSRDSRHFGSLDPKQHLIGLVLGKTRPPRRSARESRQSRG